MKIAMPMLLLLVACAGAPEPTTPESNTHESSTPEPSAAAPVENSPVTTETPPADDPLIRTTGKMVYLDLEGGFWGIEADDGRKFDPLELDEKFHKEGLRVVFEAVPNTDMMSTRMWGTLVELRKIELEK